MERKKELANILKAELILLSKDILQNIHQKDLKSLYKATRQLQEKMAAIMVLKDRLDTNELKEILNKRSENSYENDNQEASIPEITHDVLEKKFKEIKKDQGQNTELTQQNITQSKENPYKQVSKMHFVPKEEKETSQPAQPPQSAQPVKSSMRLKKMSIGLNDRISFIKHLFAGDSEYYSFVIDKLNAFENYEDALRFINLEIKPQYNDWEGKDEYEFRLLQLLELKFA